MAASIMMETLKQIHSDLTDQKEYMRNFHDILTDGKLSDQYIKVIGQLTNKNIDEKFDRIEEKISDLHKKIDQQQITIERLEQHVKKNNMLLFGNDDAETKIENILLKKTDQDEKKTKHNDDQPAMVEQLENCIDNTESKQPNNTFLEADTEETVKNCKDDSTSNDQFQKKNNGEDKDGELTSNEVRELKELVKEYIITRKTSTDETKSVHKEKVEKICPTFFTEEQMSKLNAELERISEKYRLTDTFPIIKVVPGPHREHAVIKELRKGVTYQSYDKKTSFAIKLGRDDYKVSEIREVLKEYPNLILFDVVRQLLTSRNLWSGLNQKVNFAEPKPYALVL